MPWAVLGESVTGTSHRARNTPCQDAFRARLFGADGEWLVVAVADGAGTAAHSNIGAAVTCEVLTRRVADGDPRRAFTRDHAIALFADARAAVVAEADRLNVRPRELACTALLVVVGPTDGTVAQVGDGAVVFGTPDMDWVAFWPEPTEYANATDFLTDDRFADALRFDPLGGPVDEVAVFTDGLQRLALDFATGVPHGAFFTPLFHTLRTAADPQQLHDPFRGFLDSARVNARTDDDKTLVLAVRRP